MKLYKRILVAIELDPASQSILQKAKKLATECQAELSVVHVIEPLVGYAYVYSGIAEIEAEMVKQRHKQLEKMGADFGVDIQHQHVVTGPTKYAILELGKALNVDLYVVGSHGRNGLAKILGSTANAILNGADVDVLTVRYSD